MASFATWLPTLIAVAGSGGLAWVLKFQREDQGKAVEHVEAAMVVLRLLNDDLLEAFKRVATERDDYHAALIKCQESRANH